MNLLPKTKEEFSKKEYWDNFFKKIGNEAFEWYGEYPELSEYLHKYIKNKDDILIVGCGNSSLGRDLYDVGYNKIMNIDISQVVIRQMLSQMNKKPRPGLQYIQMDALDMPQFDNDTYSVVVDKGTLDALMPNDNQATLEKIQRYFNEIHRVLRVGGRYICVTLLQEHILRYVLDYFPKNNWMFRVIRCHDVERKDNEEGNMSVPTFMLICTKFKLLPKPILEINLTRNDKMRRLDIAEELVSEILDIQKASVVCNGLKQTRLTKLNDVSIELFEEGGKSPRYTIFIVDVEKKPSNAEYAAFVVAQGRESEWMFSTAVGRSHLVSLTNHNRLAIIILHRGQNYNSLQDVQFELSEVVCNLAPASLKRSKIPFLALGDSVGKRTIVHEGESLISGRYVIEDVETDIKSVFRRLYYLSSQLVIQSEAKLLEKKTNRNARKQNKGSSKIKTHVDLTFLNCAHHYYMCMGAYIAACLNKTSSTSNRISVIGLGGGGLCSFLHKFIPSTSIIGVDLDEEMLTIARQWFGFIEDDRMTAEIIDGVEYLKNAAEKGTTMSAILFDIDNKDTSIGMSCPPAVFLENNVLTDVSTILGNEGVFILNVVQRDKTLRPPIIEKLKQHFDTLVCYDLVDDLNEVMLGFKQKDTVENIKDKFRISCIHINKFSKKNNHSDLIIDEQEFLEKLEIHC